MQATYEANSQATKPVIAINPSCTSLSDNVTAICTAKSPCPPLALHSVTDTLIAHGYMPLHEVATALQGSIMKASRQTTTNVIKITNKCLYNKHMTIVDGQELNVSEDILKETRILKYLTSHHPPRALAKFVDFFEDAKRFFLVMEDGGTNLFDFVVQCHGLLAKGCLEVSVWHSFLKIAMRQMVSVIEWMHTEMRCCHLDISLENFVISNVNMIIDGDSVRFDTDFQIKLIDFGLAEVFVKRNTAEVHAFNCTKYVGKTLYKCPEIYYRKRVFDARSADCWSLGVCFFMMIVGSPPYTVPSKKDPILRLLLKGQYVEVLSAWQRIDYVTVRMLDLLRRIIVKEKYRLNIEAIRRHPFLACVNI
eukprot:125936_1